jgi:hypothetical protein
VFRLNIIVVANISCTFSIVSSFEGFMKQSLSCSEDEISSRGKRDEKLHLPSMEVVILRM